MTTDLLIVFAVLFAYTVPGLWFARNSYGRWRVSQIDRPSIYRQACRARHTALGSAQCCYRKSSNQPVPVPDRWLVVGALLAGAGWPATMVVRYIKWDPPLAEREKQQQRAEREQARLTLDKRIAQLEEAELRAKN